MDRRPSSSRQRFHALSERARSVTRRLPGGGFALRQARAAEDFFLEELRFRLNRPQDDEPAASLSLGEHAGQRSPAAILQGLVDRSLDQRPDGAEDQLYIRLLDQLLPDEARILAAASDGNPIAICHLDASSRLGTSSLRMISNASRVGNESGVMLTGRVPHYISHLRTLGLFEAGSENKDLSSRYELIENDSPFRKAAAHIENEMNLRPKVDRGTVILSSLGHDLWQACHPEE